MNAHMRICNWMLMWWSSMPTNPLPPQGRRQRNMYGYIYMYTYSISLGLRHGDPRPFKDTLIWWPALALDTYELLWTDQACWSTPAHKTCKPMEELRVTHENKLRIRGTCAVPCRAVPWRFRSSSWKALKELGDLKSILKRAKLAQGF